ncbi:MAG: NusG domain II-containing protein [Ruminococcaceae bacterium]|nr:NusG domain II-containing protein [Oscillospiraceae bacterium]
MKNIMKYRKWLIIIGAALLLCVALIFLLPRPMGEITHAQIYSDGKLFKTVSLKKNQTFEVKTEHGSNIINVSQGEIAVITSTCSDRLCIMSGFHREGEPIKCEANHLEIRFTDKAE